MSVANGNNVAISLNKSSTGHEVVTLIFNGNPKHLMKYAADSMIEVTGIESVVGNDDETPFAPNMRALSNCDGGTLIFRNVEYNIKVESVEEGKFDLEIFVLILVLLVSWMSHIKYFVRYPVVLTLTSLL